MAGRNRGWRRWQRHLKLTRRLRRGAGFYELPWSSRTLMMLKSRLADTPAHCSCRGCGNERFLEKGVRSLTCQERRAGLARKVLPDAGPEAG